MSRQSAWNQYTRKAFTYYRNMSHKWRRDLSFLANLVFPSTKGSQPTFLGRTKEETHEAQAVHSNIDCTPVGCRAGAFRRCDPANKPRRWPSQFRRTVGVSAGGKPRKCQF